MRFGGWIVAPLLGVSVGLVAWSRPEAAEDYAKLTQSPEFYGLPPPAQLSVFSLGYRSALSDLLFGRTLVESGICFSEKRVFEAIDAYLDAVVTLDPGYRDPYYYADSLMTLSTVVMPPRNYRLARDLQERGRRVFVDDSEFWLSSGQFMAFLAPPHLPPAEDPKEWKVDGARVIEHACSIWPDPTSLPPACLSAANLLGRTGEAAASADALRRLIELSDDPQVKAEAGMKLETLTGEVQMRSSLSALSSLNESDLPLASRTAYQLMGPPSDFRRCAGHLDAAQSARCATSFRAWAEFTAAGR